MEMVIWRKSDFLSNGEIEVPFQFCKDCDTEWLCDENKVKQ